MFLAGFEFHAPVVGGGDPARDRKPEPRAIGVPAPHESFEDPSSIRGRDGRTVVRDAEHGVAVDVVDVRSDATTHCCVSDRVVQQVGHQSVQQGRVSGESHFLGTPKGDSHTTLLRQDAQRADALSDDLVELDELRPQRESRNMSSTSRDRRAVCSATIANDSRYSAVERSP